MTPTAPLDELLTGATLPARLRTCRTLRAARSVARDPLLLDAVLQSRFGPEVQRWALRLHVPDHEVVAAAGAVQSGLTSAPEASARLTAPGVPRRRHVSFEAVADYLVEPRAPWSSVGADDTTDALATELLLDGLAAFEEATTVTATAEAITVLSTRWTAATRTCGGRQLLRRDLSSGQALARSLRRTMPRSAQLPPLCAAAADRWLVGATRSDHTWRPGWLVGLWSTGVDVESAAHVVRAAGDLTLCDPVLTTLPTLDRRIAARRARTRAARALATAPTLAPANPERYYAAVLRAS